MNYNIEPINLDDHLIKLLRDCIAKGLMIYVPASTELAQPTIMIDDVNGEGTVTKFSMREILSDQVKKEHWEPQHKSEQPFYMGLPKYKKRRV